MKVEMKETELSLEFTVTHSGNASQAVRGKHSLALIDSNLA